MYSPLEYTIKTIKFLENYFGSYFTFFFLRMGDTLPLKHLYIFKLL